MVVTVGDCTTLPEVAVSTPSPVQEVAFVEVQLIVLDSPTVMVAGLTLSETVGAGVVPPPPVPSVPWAVVDGPPQAQSKATGATAAKSLTEKIRINLAPRLARRALTCMWRESLRAQNCARKCLVCATTHDVYAANAENYKEFRLE